MGKLFKKCPRLLRKVPGKLRKVPCGSFSRKVQGCYGKVPENYGKIFGEAFQITEKSSGKLLGFNLPGLTLSELKLGCTCAQLRDSYLSLNFVKFECAKSLLMLHCFAATGVGRAEKVLDGVGKHVNDKSVRIRLFGQQKLTFTPTLPKHAKAQKS